MGEMTGAIVSGNSSKPSSNTRRMTLFKKGNNLTCDNLPPRSDIQSQSLHAERRVAENINAISSGVESSKRNPLFTKTRMCPWHFKGCCDLGEDCRFAHSQEELRRTPDLSKTSLCPRLMRQKICTKPGCTYAHHQAELRTTQDFFKTSLCHMWQKGRCSAGRHCRHAHGEEELRSEVLSERNLHLSTKSGYWRPFDVTNTINRAPSSMSGHTTTCDGWSTIHESDSPPCERVGSSDLGPSHVVPVHQEEAQLLLQAAAILLEQAAALQSTLPSGDISAESKTGFPHQEQQPYEAQQPPSRQQQQQQQQRDQQPMFWHPEEQAEELFQTGFEDCNLLVAALQQMVAGPAPTSRVTIF